MENSRKFELVDVDSVFPWDQNPRRNQKAVQEVARSITEFGFNRPIVVAEAEHPFPQRTICAGHTAWQAAKEAGLAKIPAVIVKMTKEQFVRYNIADNRTHDIAEWDINVLSDLVNEFKLDDVPGFCDEELSLLVSDVESELDNLDKEKPEEKLIEDCVIIELRVTRERAKTDEFKNNLLDFCKANGFIQYTVR